MQNKLPKTFTQKLEKIFSKAELDIIYNGYSTEKRPVTFRVNTLKATNEEIENELSKNHIIFEKISYLTNGYKLPNSKESDLWKLPIFTVGKIYLQGATSQFLGEIIKSEIPPLNLPLAGETSFNSSPARERLGEEFKILDLTAAPGGKTSHISALTNNSSETEIVANELNAIRLEKLKFTLNRQGATNVKVIKGDAKNLKNIYSENYFDIIIADLPCSAEGRINLHNEKSYGFLENEGLNTKNYKVQKEILESTIGLLKEDGVLIYSTCTLDPRENEGIIHFLLSNHKNLVLEDISNFFQDKNILPYTKTGIKSFDKYIYNKEVSKAVRILPSIETEGFFIAKIKKLGT